VKKSVSGKIGRLIGIYALAILFFVSSVGAVYAYYDRGTIGVSPAQAEVTLVSGQSQTIGVGISPASDSHPVGCGDPECPQICGELECDDGNGNCKCGGPEYLTWEASVAASSSDSSVASASYGGGSLTITGISAGTATITITAQMHQFTQGSATIHVTVNSKNPDSGNTDNKPPKTEVPEVPVVPPPSSPPEAEKIEESPEQETQKTEVTKPKTAAETATATEKTEVSAAKPAPARAERTEAIVSDGTSYGKGPDGRMRTIVDLDSSARVREQLAKAIGKDETVVFRKLDEVGNVIYSLTFLGLELTGTPDLNMMAKITDAVPENIHISGSALLLEFDKQETLPGRAEAYVSVGSYFGDAVAIDAYQIVSETGPPEKIAEGLQVTSGYAVFDITSTNDVILTSGKIGGDANSSRSILVVTAIVAIAAAIVLIRRHGKRKAKPLD
jgi:hypothetical protein